MFVRIRQAAIELGISEQTIRSLINDGKIRFIRPTTRTTRVSLEDLKTLAFKVERKNSRGVQAE